MVKAGNHDLVEVLPLLCDRSVRSGFELQLGGDRCVVQCLWHRGRVIVGSNVDPSHRRVRSGPHLTSR